MINWQVIGQLVATGAIMLSGPAVIVLLALKKGNLQQNLNNIVNIKFLRNIYDLDGSIPAFKDFHPSSFSGTLYAYIKCDKKNNFIKIREKSSFTKNPHQEYASCGIYYFKSFEIFILSLSIVKSL